MIYKFFDKKDWKWKNEIIQNKELAEKKLIENLRNEKYIHHF